jgi:signal transduction histidine kinase
MENEVILRDKSAKCSDYKAQVESNLEEVGKVSALADRLLKLSKSEKLSLGDVDVLKVVNEAIEKFSKTPKFKNIEIKNKVRSKKITANADALEQILVILIDNAIKYSPKKSVVTISNGDGKIAVSDQGPGIAVEDLPYIFDRFYRAEKSRTTDGYGLGLSLAQHLAARQNLRIAVENIKKGGAKFTIL